MKLVTIITLVLTTLLTRAQDGNGFTSTKRGTSYKIITLGQGEPMAYGHFFEFSYEMRYQNTGLDSLMSGSDYASNSIAILDTLETPSYIYDIFKQCRKGDSVVLKVSVDSAYAGGPLPKGITKEGFFFSTYRIVNVYTTKAEADSVYMHLRTVAQQKALAKAGELLVKDSKIIEAYLAKHNITAVKAPRGTYVQIITPGTGAKIDSNTTVMVNYTARTIAGKAVDSNTDPAFAHIAPYEVKMWAPEVIAGWVDGLGMLSKGAKAKFYVPSGLAYSERGNGDDIKPNEIMMFDIEVVKVTPKPKPVTFAKPKAKARPGVKKQVKKKS